ncbi:PP2C family protein-serine/threonine phosphatase [Boseongicola aestuarii]|uniref:Phosphoserine phosphatase RsbP n=1 Tax=Boseongicola aestuarii TaxID=1470561 RepID=A0A238J3Q0_9RHOB|nr:fused response regulator/phosphatase [Boseongicola aestuarii]SMX24963.1 Phosphoserine phosphatase RsbP [Boseongicola aestuarii]
MNAPTPVIPAKNEADLGRPVLVVDDSRAQRRLLTKALARWGHTTLEAESGEAALELCRSIDIEFVISDWVMPGMSGVAFCRAFREMMRDKPAYFILLTAQTEREVLAEGLESGADDFLSKPFNTIEMKARITAGQRILSAQLDVKEKNDLLTKTLSELQDLYSAIDRDLLEARLFQQALVPERHFVLAGGSASLLYEPSGHVGRDLVGVFPISEKRYGVYAVDVAGHGVASALMTARIAGLLNPSSPERNLALVVDENGGRAMRPPADVCGALNELMLAEIETDRYLTMILADVDLETGRAVLSQAGHPSPAILRKDGTVEYVSSFGMPIGLIPDAEFTSFEINLAKGDRLLLHSDGITECPIPDTEDLFEEEGLKTLLLDIFDKHGPDFIDALHQGLSRASGLTDFPDDLSAVLLERTV